MVLNAGSIIYNNSKSRDKIKELHQLTPKSRYELSSGNATILGIKEEGILGELHTCLSKHRPVSGRRPKGADVLGVDLVVGGLYTFDLSVSDGEIFNFVLRKKRFETIDGWVTPSFAVNCELELLNKL
ncbi:hypothetical protein [Enterovibrio norvegicus]|uniref:Uncharacterized protein n=1 Tax=Enterovibrio norvegicus TaxID=188144 RepID=A0A2N7LH84_9GAMM|nr:hypothetical protein [Enterovibrio norvegicus]PMN94899.1 hypothetical protein BCT23_02380 [Enterovibrio norvegicus]